MWSKFRLNDLIVITQPIVIDPCDTVIEKGERGRIIDVDPETQDLTIKMVSVDHPELLSRRNYVALSADETYKIRRIKRHRNYMPWLIAAFGAYAVSAFLGLPDKTAHALRAYPIVYNRLTNLTPHIHSGQPLTLEVETLRVRPCIWKWSMKWERISGKDAVVAASLTEASHIEEVDKPAEHDTSVPTPNLSPGEYMFHSTGLAECDYGDQYTWTNEPVEFTVDP